MVGTNPKNPFSSFFIYRTYVKTCRFLHDRISTLLIKIILNLFVRSVFNLSFAAFNPYVSRMYQGDMYQGKETKKKKKMFDQKIEKIGSFLFFSTPVNNNNNNNNIKIQ